MYTFTKEHNLRNIEVIRIVDLHSNTSVSLNSTVSPISEIKKFGEKLSNNKCFFIIGSGNGTLLEYLLQTNFNSKFFIIEVFPEIDYEEHYKKELLKHHIYYYQANSLNYIQISSLIRESLGMDFEILIHPNYDKINKELLNPVIEKIKMGTTTARINKNTEKFFMFEWLIEPLLNLALSKEGKSVLEIKHYFQNKPVILVASGPSLVENLDFIRNNKENALIIASGSAINGLMSHGIVPDFVTVIDASEINFTAHFQNSKYTGPIISAGTTNHLILKHHKGEIYFTNLSQDTITEEVRPELLKIPTIPSVALYSLLLTHYLGASEVFLVGQDLALKNGEYYASGVHKHEGMRNLGLTKEVEGNLGDKVVTTLPLASTLETFNNVVSVIFKANENIKIYNLSKIGAKIKGVSFIDANEIQLKEKIDKSWINTINTINRETLDYSLTLQYLEKIKNCKSEVDEVYRKINRLNSNAVTLQDLERLLKLIKSLRENNMLEKHILNMIYSKTKSINNMFEFGFEDNFNSNEERVEMLNKLKIFVRYIQEYLEGLLSNDSWSEIYN